MKRLFLLIVFCLGCAHIKEANKEAAYFNTYGSVIDEKNQNAHFNTCEYFFQMTDSEETLRASVMVTLNDSSIILSSKKNSVQKKVDYSSIRSISYFEKIKSIEYSDIWLKGILAFGGRNQNFYLFRTLDGGKFVVQYKGPPTRVIWEELLQRYTKIGLTYPGFD
jgi:hypothetical protein